MTDILKLSQDIDAAAALFRKTVAERDAEVLRRQEIQEDRDAAHRGLDALRAERDQAITEVAVWARDCAKAERDAEVLRAQLLRYGQHRNDCRVVLTESRNERFCDCGFVVVRAGATGPTGCHCLTCEPPTFAANRMVLCPTCGNKRCPHATDHRNACTGSNAPGQPGSAFS